MPTASSVTPEFQLVATYLDSKVIENGGVDERNRFVGAPEHTASLFGSYSVLEGQLSGLRLGGGMIFVGDRPVDGANEVLLDDYLVFDAFIGFEDQIENGPS